MQGKRTIDEIASALNKNKDINHGCEEQVVCIIYWPLNYVSARNISQLLVNKSNNGDICPAKGVNGWLTIL